MGGIVLLREALQKLSPTAPDKDLEGKWTERLQRDAFQYFSKEAYRALMNLYEGMELYSEALRVYQACKKALWAGLHTQPDPVTRALYEGIRKRSNKSSPKQKTRRPGPNSRPKT